MNKICAIKMPLSMNNLKKLTIYLNAKQKNDLFQLSIVKLSIQ